MSQELKSNWLPSATKGALQARAEFYQHIRTFFSKRGVLEVETPILGRSNSPDIHLQPFFTQGEDELVLQTSPEFFMKRLLASGSGDIFQIAKVFRHEEYGRQHNPEFSMLEWYRVGWDHLQLIEEVEALLHVLLHTPKAIVITIESLFKEVFEVNPHHATAANLQAVVAQSHGPEHLNAAQCFDYLFSCALEKLDPEKLWVVKDFPIYQAALARIHPQGYAERFEFYYQGYELANGYHELKDVEEQRQRFESEIGMRKDLGHSSLQMDHKFLEALKSLPDCAGVAMGLDRLLMLKCNQSDIAKVMSFNFAAL